MVGPETSTTSSGRRIDEIEIGTGSKLSLQSKHDSVPTRPVIEESGRYVVIRIGDLDNPAGSNSTLSTFGADEYDLQKDMNEWQAGQGSES